MNTLVELNGRRTRRRHTAEFKASVIEACRRPGVSIASIALANGLNANMLRKWVIDAELRDCHSEPSSTAPPVAPPASGVAAFVPLQLPAPQTPTDIHIELQRGATRVTLTRPVNASADCAAWLRELLR
jgi:transposase-like protein